MKKLFILSVSVIMLLAACSSPVRKAEPVSRVESKVEQTQVQTPVVQEPVPPADITPPVVYSVAADPTEGIEDPYVEDGVNWSARTITATGIGAPNPNAPNMAVKRAGAINAAKMVALRDLLATLKGMYLSSESTVENYMTTSDVINTQVEGIAKAFRVVGEPNYFEDGSVEVTVEMSMNGELSDILMKENEFGEEKLVGQATYKLSDLTKQPDVYTGLVIDCKPIQLRPALAPKIFNKSGEEIYGSANVNREFAVQQGMLGYLKSVDTAVSNARVANNPLVIKAIGVKGTNKSDIIISDEDAAKIKQLDSKHNFLKECRVIAIIN